MQHIPALDFQAISTQGLVARDTPDIRRDVALCQYLLRL
jgi:hypothetical protein